MATAVTCGVDSTYTIYKYTQDHYKSLKLTHLVVASVSSDLWDFEDSDNLHKWEEKHKTRFERYYKVSEYTGLPLVKIFTNFAHFIIQRYKYHESYRHVHVHSFITLGAVLSISRLFRVYLFSSGYDFTHFSVHNHLMSDTADYDLLLNDCLSTFDFRVFSSGGSVDRIDKTLELTKYTLAKKVLHPCFKDTPINCTLPTCSKCLRALVALDHFGKLDEMNEVFDMGLYKRNRSVYLHALFRSRKSPNFSYLYDLYMKEHTADMEEAKKLKWDEVKQVK